MTLLVQWLCKIYVIPPHLFLSFRLILAWNALSEIGQLTKSSKSLGLIAKWDPEREKILATGDSKVVRIWDMKTELKVGDWPTGAECLVTSVNIHRCGKGRGICSFCTLLLEIRNGFKFKSFCCRTESSRFRIGGRSSPSNWHPSPSLRVWSCHFQGFWRIINCWSDSTFGSNYCGREYDWARSFLWPPLQNRDEKHWHGHGYHCLCRSFTYPLLCNVRFWPNDSRI